MWAAMGGTPQLLGEERSPSKSLVPSAPTLPPSPLPEPPKEAHLPLPPAGLPRDTVTGQSCFPKEVLPCSSPAGIPGLWAPVPEPGHTICPGLAGGVEVGFSRRRLALGPPHTWEASRYPVSEASQQSLQWSPCQHACPREGPWGILSRHMWAETVSSLTVPSPLSLKNRCPSDDSG